jgi:hypothetical protein
MPSAADEFRELANDIRSIPGEFGLREYQCFLVRKTWTGARPGDGDEVEKLIPLVVGGGQNPRVRFPTQRDIALGNMSIGEILIGPLTPQYVDPGGGTGGTARVRFDGSELVIGQGQFVRVYAPDEGDSSDYKVNYVNVDRALRVTLKCTNVTASGI